MAKKFEEFIKEASDIQYFTGKNTVKDFIDIDMSINKRSYDSDTYKQVAVDLATKKPNNVKQEDDDLPGIDVNYSDEILNFSQFNENADSFLDNLSLEELKEIGSYLEIWMQSDNVDFDMSKIDRIFELLKGSKYMVSNGEMFRLLFFDINSITKEDGHLDIDKIKSSIRVDDKYYSYNKTLADTMYLYWGWTEFPEFMEKRGEHGIVIKQQIKNGFDVTSFNLDAYTHINNNYKSEEGLLSTFRTFTMLEDQGENEIISKKDSSYEIEGIIAIDFEHSKDHSNSHKVKSYDDFEEEGLFFYKPEDFKL